MHKGVILKFDDDKDLQTYVDAKSHKEYQQATAEQTAGMFWGEKSFEPDDIECFISDYR